MKAREDRAYTSLFVRLRQSGKQIRSQHKLLQTDMHQLLLRQRIRDTYKHTSGDRLIKKDETEMCECSVDPVSRVSSVEAFAKTGFRIASRTGGSARSRHRGSGCCAGWTWEHRSGPACPRRLTAGPASARQASRLSGQGVTRAPDLTLKAQSSAPPSPAGKQERRQVVSRPVSLMLQL